MSLFRSNSAARNNRFVPQIEQLDERLVPAVVVPSVTVFNHPTWGLTLSFRTNSNNDRVTITDNGLGTTGNVRVVIADTQTGLVSDLRNFTAGRNIRRVECYNDGSGRDEVTYEIGRLGPGMRRSVHVDLGEGDDSLMATVRSGLGSNTTLAVSGDGWGGNDRMEVEVGNRLSNGADLRVDFEGGLGFDDVSLDAWTLSPTVDPGASISADLSGYLHGQRDNTPDAANLVSFWYLGRMDGTLTFNLQGSSGDDWVSANLWVNAGSMGTVGDGYVRGGGGNDDLDYIVRGDAGLKFTGQQHLDGGSDGGPGTRRDHVDLARNQAPNFQFDVFRDIESIGFVP